jgi:hypothetical protein
MQPTQKGSANFERRRKTKIIKKNERRKGEIAKWK